MLSDDLQGYRLSPQQKRVWSLWRGEGAAYGARCVLLLEGGLNEEALQAALRQLVGRHEILRTAYHSLPGMPFPVQAIEEEGRVDWQAETAGEEERSPEAWAGHLLQAESGISLSSEDAGLRARLLRLGEGRSLLALSLSALSADALTVDNLVRHLARTYDEIAAGGADGAEDEPVRYVQFSEWQCSLLEDEGDTEGREFWQKEGLEGTAELRFPFELPRIDRSRFEPKFVVRVLDPAQTAQVYAAAAEADSSADLVLLACWQVLLGKLSGGSSFAVAMPYGGRTYDVFEDALGLFARWVPVRCRLRGDRSFKQILEEARRLRDGAFEWGDAFDWQVLGGGGSEFLPAAFELAEWPAEERVNGLVFRLLEKDVCWDRFKLKLTVFRRDGELVLKLGYDAARFLREDVERAADLLMRGLANAVANPGMMVGEIEWLSEAERRRLVVDLNQTSMAHQGAPCFHQLFEQQVDRTPDLPAVVDEDRSLTYVELNARANRLAHHLRRHGVGPETLVALCLDRSVDLVVGLLGVLKAGGAYVPLEPSQPQQRLNFLLEDLDAPVALVHASLEDRLSSYRGKLVRIDADWEEIATEPDENPRNLSGGEDLMYVIFTSGSTGRPKGVAVEHRQLVNYTLGVIERLELPEQVSFANVSTFAADLGNTAVFPALCTGGCLHVVAQERLADARAMADYFQRHRIDCLKIVPSHFEALQTLPEAERFLPQRRLVLGGEASRPDWIRELLARGSDCVLFNHYGPSETTVGVLTYRAEPGQLDERCATLPLGRPIPNTQVYLLDSGLRPVPVWVPGELYIGGASVSRGYLRRPDLTADRFVPDAFSAEPGARLYRTGDLARLLPDGNVEFLGRVDDQVKFHGFRVELNEIRCALNSLPQVRDSVVTLAKDGNGRDVLIAYYVSRHELEVAPLREGLRESILEETIPNLFVHLKKLPLTLNGKINYAALPSLEDARKMVKRVFVAPRNATEETMAAIWAEVLGLERVSIHDNFFELGGHSLLATRVISRQREAFQVEIPLRGLFETPTIAALAAVLERVQNEGGLAAAAAGPIPSTLSSIDHQLMDLELLSDEEAGQFLESPSQ